MSRWDEETLGNIEKLRSVRLPPEGFELFPGVTVVDTKKFMDALGADIERGPDGIRAKMGAVQKEIKRLVELFGGKP